VRVVVVVVVSQQTQHTKSGGTKGQTKTKASSSTVIITSNCTSPKQQTFCKFVGCVAIPQQFRLGIS
jgi:hypothetical protein